MSLDPMLSLPKHFPLSDRRSELDRRTLAMLVSSELQERVDHELSRLKEPFRSVFVLREIEGMSYETIAETLDTW